MKFIGWLGKMVLIIVMVSTLTVFTTGLVVNAYIKSMLASFNIQLEGQPFAWGSVLQGLMGKKDSVTAVEDKDSKEQVTKEDSDKVAESSSGTKGSDTTNKDQSTGNGENGSESESDKTESSVDEEAPVDALPVMGETQTEIAGVGKEDHQIIVSPDDLVRKKDDLPVGEKEEIFNILMTKLPQEKVQEITVAMENGLTEQELKQVEGIISKYLSEDEYAKLIKLLKS